MDVIVHCTARRCTCGKDLVASSEPGDMTLESINTNRAILFNRRQEEASYPDILHQVTVMEVVLGPSKATTGAGHPGRGIEGGIDRIN